MGKVNTGDSFPGVYKITNNLNGKYYIGQSIDVNYRMYEHRIGIKKNSALDTAIRKYGANNFTYEVLEKCDKDSVLERERYWAEDVFNGMCYAPFGYNIDRTGRGGQRINWITQYTLEGQKIKSYITPTEAGRQIGVSGTAIIQALKTGGICRGTIWKYGLSDSTDPYIRNKYGTPIKCYDKDGNLKMTFDNGVDASKYFGITTSAISSYVKHKNGFVCCKGYYLAKGDEPPIIREKLRKSRNN